MIFGKYINKYYLKYSYFFILGILALLGVDFLTLKVPEYLGAVVRGVKGDSTVDIKNILLMIVLIAALQLIGRMVFRYTLFNASKRIEADLRTEMFNKATKLSQRYYHQNKVGTIMAWFTNDLENVEEFFGWGTVMLIDALFLTVFALYKMIAMEWVLTLILAIPLLFIVVWGLFCEKFMAKCWEDRQTAFDSLYDYTQENFTGIRVIKAFVREKKEIHTFAKVAKNNEEVNVKFAKISVLFEALIEIIIYVIMSILLGFGAWFVYAYNTGNPINIFGHTINFSADELVTYSCYFENLIWPMIAMGQIISMRSRCKTAINRISRFLDEEVELADKPGCKKLENATGKIEFRNFSFKFPDGDYDVLNNINLTIEAGQMIGVVGKIGSGKTTLVNSLLRLYNFEPNTLLFDDKDVMDLTIESVRDNISYVPQDNFLFSDKIKNNIAFSDRKMSKECVIEAATFSDVHANIEGFKDGYETVSGERGVTLSGGQKQRVSIARAYAKHAPIMILDDSVSAVDVKTEETILNNIKEKRNGLTTIVVASRVSTVKKLDKIIVLKDGNLEAFDTHDNLLKISPTYQKMVYLQALEAEVEGGVR